ncbi:MAG: M28 family peptidase [Verrucomicrobiota bacterium]
MRIITRKGLIRIAIVMVALPVIAKFAMCDCGRGRIAMGIVPSISATNLSRHVHYIAGELGEHNVTIPWALKKAATYIEAEWRAQGHTVTRWPYKVQEIECDNLEITFTGTTKPKEIVIIGAHYDSVEGAPGANDNGSGVAALLELSRHFANANRTVRFVAFVNEEPPYYETELMGSRVYAQACRQRGDDVRAMISLETMGYFSDEPGSQKFPSVLFKLVYPTKGNFIGFVGNFSSRKIIRQAAAGFRGASDFPLECCATYGGLAGIGWSDHASFWKEGYPAFQISDTAPFRYPYYHTAEDTPDKLNYPALARVTQGVYGAIRALAE